MISKQRISILNKLAARGYQTEKEIYSITMEDIPKLCRTLSEVTDIVLLQKALKANKLLSYLTGAYEEKEN